MHWRTNEKVIRENQVRTQSGVPLHLLCQQLIFKWITCFCCKLWYAPFSSKTSCGTVLLNVYKWASMRSTRISIWPTARGRHFWTQISLSISGPVAMYNRNCLMGSNPIMLQQRSLPMTLQQVHLCYNCMYNTCQNLYLQLGDMLPTLFLQVLQ